MFPPMVYSIFCKILEINYYKIYNIINKNNLSSNFIIFN